MSRFTVLQDNSGPFVIQTDTGDTIHAVLQNRQGEFFPLPQYELDSNKQIIYSLQTQFTTAPQNWDEYNPGTPFIPTPLLTVKTPDWDDTVNGTFQEQERKSMQPKPFTVAVSSIDFRKLICSIMYFRTFEYVLYLFRYMPIATFESMLLSVFSVKPERAALRGRSERRAVSRRARTTRIESMYVVTSQLAGPGRSAAVAWRRHRGFPVPVKIQIFPGFFQWGRAWGTRPELTAPSPR